MFLDLLECDLWVWLFDAPDAVTLSLVCLLLALQAKCDVLVLQGFKVAVLFLRRKGVEISSFHAEQVFRMLANDIDAGTSCEIGEGDAQSMDEDCFHHSFAASALV